MPAFDAVYAEIELIAHADLPPDLARSLASRFPGATPAAAAVAETVLRDDPGISESVAYSRISPDRVYLVFSESRRSMKVHLQRRSQTSTLADVKRAAEEMAEQFTDFLNYYDRKPREIRIKLSAGGSHLQTGIKLSRWQRVKRVLSGELLTTLTLALTAIFISFVFREDARKAVLDGLIATLALTLRSVVSAVTQRLEYEYA